MGYRCGEEDGGHDGGYGGDCAAAVGAATATAPLFACKGISVYETRNDDDGDDGDGDYV